MGKQSEARVIDERLQNLALMREELMRRQDSQSRRLGTVETTSGVLIASSAIIATLLSADTSASGWLGWAALFSLVAAGCGVGSLYPRAISELKPLELRGQILALDAVGASLWLNDRLIEHITIRESAIHDRFRLVQVGLSFLGGSILLALLPLVLKWVVGA